MPHFLKPGLGLLVEELFPLRRLLFPLRRLLFPLRRLLFPFEPEFSGLEEMPLRLKAPRHSFKRMRSGMKPEAFRLQPEEHGFL